MDTIIKLLTFSKLNSIGSKFAYPPHTGKNGSFVVLGSIHKLRKISETDLVGNSPCMQRKMNIETR